MILLDSHVLAWALLEQSRIGPKTRRLIDRSTSRFVSSLTHVEFTIKAMKGRVVVPAELLDDVESVGLEVLPFAARHAQCLREFTDLANHDPFDRMLLAQARADGLTFVTADRRLLELGLDWVVDAAA